MKTFQKYHYRFNAVQNNTSLKPTIKHRRNKRSFNAVQNNTSLKHATSLQPNIQKF